MMDPVGISSVPFFKERQTSVALKSLCTVRLIVIPNITEFHSRSW